MGQHRQAIDSELKLNLLKGRILELNSTEMLAGNKIVYNVFRVGEDVYRLGMVEANRAVPLRNQTEVQTDGSPDLLLYEFEAFYRRRHAELAGNLSKKLNKHGLYSYYVMRTTTAIDVYVCKKEDDLEEYSLVYTASSIEDVCRYYHSLDLTLSVLES